MRCGRKVEGKTRYFRKDDGAFLEREPRLARGPGDTIGEVGGRVAARPSIYVGLASPAFGFANTIKDVWRRIAARPSICVEFVSPAFG